MLRKLILLLFLIPLVGTAFGQQKKVVDASTYLNWYNLGRYNISDDGKYVWYTIEHIFQPHSVSLKSTSKAYEKDLGNVVGEPTFTRGSKHLIFMLPGDTLVVFDLTDKTQVLIPEVTEYHSFGTYKYQWLAYRLNNNAFILRNLSLNDTVQYTDVDEYKLNSQGSAVVLRRKHTFHWIDIPSFREQTILASSDIGNLTFGKHGREIFFTKKDSVGVSIYRFKPGESVQKLLSNDQLENSNIYAIASKGISFSANEDAIFFNVDMRASEKIRDSDVLSDKINLWHYKDIFILPNQIADGKRALPTTFVAVLSLSSGKILQLENPEMVLSGSYMNQKEWLLLVNRVSRKTIKEAHFDQRQKVRYELVSIKSGHRVSLDSSIEGGSLSPGGKYFLFRKSKDYYSFEISTGVIKNLTNEIKIPLDTPYIVGAWYNLGRFRGAAGWGQKDEFVLLADQFDIWQIDLSGNKDAINLTNGYGRSHHVRFTLFSHSKTADPYKLPIVNTWDRLKLIAFNLDSKENGFALTTCNSNSGLVLKDIGSYLSFEPLADGPMLPQKAENAEMYVITKESASEARNLYITNNFQQFKKLTFLTPQKDYNWMTSELITYPMKEGKRGQGILYKPENFNPEKKYPVIFQYYQDKSNELHLFRNAGHSSNLINIPTYVSSGYLVFVPDIINSEPGRIAINTVNSVESAVKYLGQYSWFDTTRMGLNGQSFGGYATNLLVAHSNLFAAAQPSSGTSDVVSAYGNLGFGQSSLAAFYELGQPYLGFTPWDSPDIYIMNSPIFHAHKVTTPVLIAHSKGDIDNVHYFQSIEWYNVLRRAGKKVWLALYDDGGHLLDPPSMYDFEKRQRQFFDHYLKGAAAPVWMTQGIRAADKGFKSGFALDAVNLIP